jgi:AcrR family transcriptional regulator
MVNVPRPPSPLVRRQLIERAAEMVAKREPVTLRALVRETGVSTMAVYTYFDGMAGLWRAVRQEGFTRLASRLADVRRTADPVRDFVALGAAYTANALEGPALYRVMFDAQFELEDPAAADAAFGALITAAERMRSGGRLRPDIDPLDVATRFWAFGHGIVMLVISGVLPAEALAAHVPPTTVAMLLAGGDQDPECTRSVRNGWRTLRVGRA